MFANLVCSPPLGQTTVLAPGTQSVHFTALLESDPASHRDWEVALWHNFNQEWKKLVLEKHERPLSTVFFFCNSRSPASLTTTSWSSIAPTHVTFAATGSLRSSKGGATAQCLSPSPSGVARQSHGSGRMSSSLSRTATWSFKTHPSKVIL